MLMGRYVLVEILKLRRSLALLLCLSAPALVALINVLIMLRGDTTPNLALYWASASAIWAFAMLPLGVTALSVLLAQSEHGPRTWDHFLALPGARPRMFLAKAFIMMACIAGMSLWLAVLVVVGGWVTDALRETVGAVDVRALVGLLGRMALAATCLAMLQLWVALRFRSFVPPLVLGIGGTFIAIASAGAAEGAYFPWLQPLHMLATTPGDQETALLLGSAGGLLALLAMLVDLHFREA